MKENAMASRTSPPDTFGLWTRMVTGDQAPWGLLNAIDLNKGEIVWQVPLGEFPELTARGIPRTGTENSEERFHCGRVGIHWRIKGRKVPRV